MPWRRRRPTSVVSAAAGANYNTWLEVRGVTLGRPTVDAVGLGPRLQPGPAATGCRAAPGVPGKGSGIFYHTSKPGHRWAPTAGCTQVGNPRQMRWLLTWLRPEAHPRVVQNR